jgi:ADP-ribose pyrophosphatase
MPSFDDEDCLRRYRALAARRPELFVNPPGLVYELLTAPDEIAAARAARTAARPDRDDTRVGVLADDPYATLLREAVRFPDGGLGLYNRILVPGDGGVVVLPVLGDRIVLIRRFRHGTRSFEWEAPRGIIGDGPSLEDDARRELAEEIGAVATELVGLGRMTTAGGIVAEWMHLFLARIDRVGAADRHEAIAEIAALSVSETETMIADGRIGDGPTLAAYLRARLAGLLG